MNWYSWYWLIWSVFLFVTFIPVELYAAFTNVQNTLSWNVWRAEKFIPGSDGPWSLPHWIIGIGAIILFVWLALHFAFGILNP